MSRGNGVDLTGNSSGGSFRPRLGRIRTDNPQLFINRVNKAVARARAASGRTKWSGTSGRFNARGRGSKVAPGLKRSYGWSSEFGMRWRARRVIVKARVVKFKGGGSKAAYAHLRYLLREGASLDRSAEDIAAERARPDEFDLWRDKSAENEPDLSRENDARADLSNGRDIGDENSPAIPLAAQRDGAARNGVENREREPQQSRSDLYTSWTNDVDVKGFLKRGKDDRHQFRFIVSPEDGAELGDLRPFTRSLMQDMERDLNTRLDWVAVDHYDTAHPHTHIVVRGVTDDGKILNIAGDYIAHGIRSRASDRLTLELGHQSEHALNRQLGREATADRFTRLDRELHRLAEKSVDNIIDLRPGRTLEKTARLRINKHLLIARAKHLEKLALAEKQKPGLWTLSPDAESTLRRLGERGDIIKGMHKAMVRWGWDPNGREGIAHARHLAYDQTPTAPVAGRIIGKELADELKGDMRLVVDGVDGHVRSVDVGAQTEAAEARIGAMIEIGPPRLKPADKTIAEIARNNAGIYDPQAHGAKLAETMEIDEARDLALAHIRRLEALRRQGIVERRENGDWLIPDDYAEKVLEYDARGGRQNTARLLSAVSLEQQLKSDGATWLDRTLLKGGDVPSLDASGFGGDVHRALVARQDKLIEDGFAERETGPDGNMIRYRKNMLAALARRELMRVGKEMAQDLGKDFAFAEDGVRIRGTYRGNVQLASGKYALVERSKEFSLVPWRARLDRELGREVAGVMRGRGVSWEFGRQRSRGLGR